MQALDLITTHEGEKDLAKYKMPTYLRIVQYKTAYYSFYLPYVEHVAQRNSVLKKRECVNWISLLYPWYLVLVACALLMAGENLDDHVAVKSILVDIGTYFQVQDDYLDCFDDPEVIGNIGTDIQDFKCSWLVVQALERVNESQLQRLYANYGKSDPACISNVKALYKELGLQDVFLVYENTSYKELISSIEAQDNKPLQHVLKLFLAKIYKRQK